MELRHLRYLLAVARYRNFLRSAEERHLAQPLLPQQIQQLERELWAMLFDRLARQIDCNPAKVSRICNGKKQTREADYNQAICLSRCMTISELSAYACTIS